MIASGPIQSTNSDIQQLALINATFKLKCFLSDDDMKWCNMQKYNLQNSTFTSNSWQWSSLCTGQWEWYKKVLVPPLTILMVRNTSVNLLLLYLEVFVIWRGTPFLSHVTSNGSSPFTSHASVKLERIFALRLLFTAIAWGGTVIKRNTWQWY